jgi:hypothetical protein
MIDFPGEPQKEQKSKWGKKSCGIFLEGEITFLDAPHCDLSQESDLNRTF